MDVFNALGIKYINVLLIYSMQTVQIKDFTDEIHAGNEGEHFTTVHLLYAKY